MGYIVTIKEKFFVPSTKELVEVVELLDKFQMLDYNYDHDYQKETGPENPRYFALPIDVVVESLAAKNIGPKPPKKPAKEVADVPEEIKVKVVGLSECINSDGTVDVDKLAEELTK